ncbi:WXG100 family type VII secretion target [Saccharopolyspora griseoalba]|uniref:WXG100 family type VII secretion target n=1 Tax=Saccharopolyspora griseoalba TaxID=1431848 RepID=A0ABW2LIX3_9PSEU
MTREHHELTEDLAALTRAADALEVSHAIPSDAEQLLGRQHDLRTAAESWRELADSAEQASGELSGKLGGIDAAWDGEDADAFLAHARELGSSGNELADAMRALAEALEHTAEALRVQTRDLRELVADAVEEVREADPERARERLLELTEPVNDVLDAVRASYRELAHRCDELGGEPQAPADSPAAPPGSGAPTSGTPAAPGTSIAPEAPAAPGGEQPVAPGGTSSAAEPSEGDGAAAAAGGVAGAAVGAAGAGVAGGMMPMGMMGGMLGRQGARAQERSNESRIKNDPEELFGAPPDAAPAVFGEPEEDSPDPAPKIEVPSTLQPGEPKPSIEDTLSPKN